MRVKQFLLLLFLGFLSESVSLLAQAPVAEPLPFGKETVLLRFKSQKLWCIQIWESGTGQQSFLVSFKADNRWKSLPLLKLKTGNKRIRIQDIEQFGGRIYVAGDFNIPGTSRYGLVYLDLTTYTWKTDAELTLTGQFPVVNSLLNHNGVLYLGGQFMKYGNTECLNLCKMFLPGYGVRAMRFNNFNGANGPVNQMVPDSAGKGFYIGGAFSKILSSSAGGVGYYSVSDSSINGIGKNFRNVIRLAVNPTSIFIANEEDTSGRMNLYIYNGSQWIKPVNVDSITSVTSIIALRGETYFCGDMKVGLLKRPNLYRLKSNLLEPAFERLYRIDIAEFYQGEFYIAGSYLNFNSINTEQHYVARIAKDLVRISGRLFLDRNTNGKFDQTDLRLGGRLIKVMPQGDLVPTDRNGFYSVLLNKKPGNVYSLIPDNRLGEFAKAPPVRIPIDTLPDEPVDMPVTFIKADYSDIRLNVRSMQGNRTSADTASFFVIHIENSGAKTERPDVTFNYNNNLIKVNPSLGPNQIDPGKLTWRSLSLEPGEERNIIIRMIAPSSAFSQNSSFGLSASVSAIVDDNTSNNTDSITQEVKNGVPAFAKFQTPAAAADDTIAWLNPATGKMDYTIRFTNTGSDTLNYVVVRDTVSTPDWVTYIQETGSSHPFSRMVYTNPALPQKVILVYTFSNLNLPPVSSVNAETGGASGFISFRMGIASSISPGTIIQNRAGILIENNIEKMTNLVRAKVMDMTAQREIDKKTEVVLFPNPSKGTVYLRNFPQGSSFTLYSPDGRKLLQSTACSEMKLPSELHYTGNAFWTITKENKVFSSGHIIFVE